MLLATMRRSARILVLGLVPCLLAAQWLPALQAGCRERCCGGESCPVCLARTQADSERDPETPSCCAKRRGCGNCRKNVPAAEPSQDGAATAAPQVEELQPACKCRHGRPEPVPPTADRCPPRGDDRILCGASLSTSGIVAVAIRRSACRDDASRVAAGPPVWIQNCSLLT